MNSRPNTGVFTLWLVGGMPRTAITPRGEHNGENEHKFLKMTLCSGAVAMEVLFATPV